MGHAFNLSLRQITRKLSYWPPNLTYKLIITEASETICKFLKRRSCLNRHLSRLNPLHLNAQLPLRSVRHSTHIRSRQNPDLMFLHRLHPKSIHRKAFRIIIRCPKF